MTVGHLLCRHRTAPVHAESRPARRADRPFRARVRRDRRKPSACALVGTVPRSRPARPLRLDPRFPDMPSRAASLQAFYGGPVWQAHREAANATMIDSDNVLSAAPGRGGFGFRERRRRARAPVGATQTCRARASSRRFYYLDAPVDDAFSAILRHASSSPHSRGRRHADCSLRDRSRREHVPAPAGPRRRACVRLVRALRRRRRDATQPKRVSPRRRAGRVSCAGTRLRCSNRAPERLVLAPTARSLPSLSDGVDSAHVRLDYSSTSANRSPSSTIAARPARMMRRTRKSHRTLRDRLRAQGQLRLSLPRRRVRARRGLGADRPRRR